MYNCIYIYTSYVYTSKSPVVSLRKIRYRYCLVFQKRNRAYSVSEIKPVLSNIGNVSFSRKQREILMWLELTTNRLPDRCSTNSAQMQIGTYDKPTEKKRRTQSCRRHTSICILDRKAILQKQLSYNYI